MGGAASGALIGKEFFDNTSKKNFLASMEFVDPKAAQSVAKSLKSKSGSVNRFVLMTTGQSESISCWQAKHIFVASWITKTLSIQPFQFIKHTYQGMEFISIYLDACAFNYMEYFMDLAKYFISKEQFIDRIVELSKSSDELLYQYFVSPTKEPTTERPVFSMATPDLYYVKQPDEIGSQVSERHAIEEDFNLNSVAEESDSISSGSRPLPHPFIPELEDLEFSETESSFLSPISEYSDRFSKDSTIQGTFSSVAPTISEPDAPSDVQPFVNGGHYEHISEASSHSKSRSSRASRSTRSSQRRSAAYSESGDSRTMSSAAESESGASKPVRSRDGASISSRRSQTQSGSARKTDTTADELSFSDAGDTRRASRLTADTMDSLTLGTNTTQDSEYSAASHSSRRKAPSQSSQSSKRRPAPRLIPQEQEPNDDIILSSESSASGSSARRRRAPPPMSRDDEDDPHLDMSSESSYSSTTRKRRNRYAGGPTDQVPMSSDDGIANEPSKTGLSTRDFRSKGASKSTRSAASTTRTGDSSAISAASSKVSGPLKSGSTNVRSTEFGQYLGTGTASTNGHRRLRNEGSPTASMTESTYSATDSRMRTGTSDFTTEKFKPFSMGTNTNTRQTTFSSDDDDTLPSQKSRNSGISPAGSRSRSSHSSSIKNFNPEQSGSSAAGGQSDSLSFSD